MSVYVGIDVHRKRSQVAVIDAKGEVLANRNVPDGTEPILTVIGGLPPGTPAAFEAAYGTSWLVELLGDYGFAPHLVHPSRCKAIASARLKNDKVDAAILGQLLRADLLPEAWIAPPPVRQRRPPGVACRVGVVKAAVYGRRGLGTGPGELPGRLARITGHDRRPPDRGRPVLPGGEPPMSGAGELAQGHVDGAAVGSDDGDGP